MKTILSTLLGISFLCATLSSCRAQATEEAGGSRLVTKNIEHVKYFSTIEDYLSCEVIFEQKEVPAVRVKATEEQLERLQLTFRNDQLSISTKPEYKLLNGRDMSGVVIYVQSPDLTGVTLYGSGEFRVPGALNTDALKVTLMGSGDIDFASVVCDDIAVNLLGSGNIDCPKVNCVRANVSVSGSGDMKVGLLNAETTNVNLLGSGNLEASFRKCGNVNCNLTGSGEIELSGDVSHLTKQIAGSGELSVGKLQIASARRQ